MDYDETRGLVGSIPLGEQSTKFILHRKYIESESYHLFWTTHWIKDYDRWIIVPSFMECVKNCQRVMKNKFDDGRGLYHKVHVKEDGDTVIALSVKDHDSFQTFSNLKECWNNVETRSDLQ